MHAGTPVTGGRAGGRADAGGLVAVGVGRREGARRRADSSSSSAAAAAVRRLASATANDKSAVGRFLAVAVSRGVVCCAGLAPDAEVVTVEPQSVSKVDSQRLTEDRSRNDG